MLIPCASIKYAIKNYKYWNMKNNSRPNSSTVTDLQIFLLLIMSFTEAQAPRQTMLMIPKLFLLAYFFSEGYKC